MAIGHASRREIFEAVEVLASRVLDAERVAQISVRRAPKLRADSGFSIESYRSRGLGGVRREGSFVLTEHTFVVRYARRLEVHDQPESQLDALDQVKALEAALAADVSSQALLGTVTGGFSVVEQPVAGWLIYDLGVTCRTLVKLQALAQLDQAVA